MSKQTQKTRNLFQKPSNESGSVGSHSREHELELSTTKKEKISSQLKFFENIIDLAKHLLEWGSDPKRKVISAATIAKYNSASFIILPSIAIYAMLNICKILFCNNRELQNLLVIIISIIFKIMEHKMW